MTESRSKAMLLVEALEELSRKETFCLKEENYEAMLRTQDKKAALARGLKELTNAPLSAAERQELNRRIQALRQQESENADTLARRMQENREVFRKLEANAKSASALLKTYGSPERSGRGAGGLQGKA